MYNYFFINIYLFDKNSIVKYKEVDLFIFGVFLV